MAGTFFEYFNGYLRVEFSGPEHGYLYMDLHIHGDTIASTLCDDHFKKGQPQLDVQADVCIKTWFSNVMCPLEQLVHWLEAVTIGVQECAFYWDGEGPDGELRWRGSWKKGVLEIKWTRGDIEHSVRLDKAQMVRAIYQAFRNFVESDRYEPLRYERLTVGECCALVIEGGDLDALTGALTDRCRVEAMRLLDAVLDLAYSRSPGSRQLSTLDEFIVQSKAIDSAIPDGSLWWVAEWDSWDVEAHRAHIVAAIYPGHAGIAFGSRLRELRSELVETWLDRHPERNLHQAA